MKKLLAKISSNVCMQKLHAQIILSSPIWYTDIMLPKIVVVICVNYK